GINDQDSGGQVMLGSARPPFWWTEGGAEYWSDNTGWNWWTAARDMNLRTTALEDRFLTWDELNIVWDKDDWGDGERGYQTGYSFGLYLRERFGDQAYAEMSKTSSKKWRTNWETIVEEVVGVPFAVLYEDWKVYVTE